MYSDVFCQVYNTFGWNYYPEIFGDLLLQWLQRQDFHPKTAMDLGCGTGILCEILHKNGIRASGMDFSSGMIDIARSSCPEIDYQVADMITFCPDLQFDLVTCTGDALNHIHDLSDVARIFQNVLRYTAPGGYFLFDILRRDEATAGEPFVVDFDETMRVFFQLTQPEEGMIALTVRTFENGALQFEEVIREKVHDQRVICELLRSAGFTVEACTDRLLPEHNGSTTWYIVAKK